jgi:hypothetical protein
MMLNSIKLRDVLTAEYPDDKNWMAFIKWWLAARGFDYRGQENLLIDGCRDGGIDIIAMPQADIGESKYFLVQSKYVNGVVSLKSLSRFFEAVKALRGQRPVFENWLASVRPVLRPIYERLKPLNRKIDFVFITKSVLTREVSSVCKRLKIQAYGRDEIAELLNAYEHGHTPRVPSVTLDTSRPVAIAETKTERLWCFSATLRSLAKAYHRHRDALFAGNVRFALKGKDAGRVRTGISETLKERPGDFIFFHNGIAVVAKSLRYQMGKTTLRYPSIVNGAQTVSHLGMLSHHTKIGHNAKALVKLVEVFPNVPFERMETDIAISSNTQNKVKFSDLMVADPDLVTLDRGFRRQSCFLERKKGANPGFQTDTKITKERLVQLLAAIDHSHGPAASKSLQKLFANNGGANVAQHLISDCINRFNGIEDAVFVAKLDSLCRSFLWYSQKKTNSRAKIAYYAIFAAYVQALKASGRWPSVKRELMNPGFRTSPIADRIYSDIRKTAAKMLKNSRRERKNEPAFYKSKANVSVAVKSVARTMRPIVRNGY